MGLEQISASLKKKLPEKSKYLHSPNHLLADELSKKFQDPKHFGFYLKMATRFDHSILRKLAAEVLEQKNVKTPAKLFAYLLKEKKEPTTPPLP
jgi:hypothetical protein